MLIVNPCRIFCFCRRLAVASAIVCGQARETSANEVIQVPFEFIRDAIVVQATIDGKGPFSVMLDTGVDPSVIDLETARQIGLKLDPKGHEASGGGTDVNLTYETELRFWNSAAGRLPMWKLWQLTCHK